MKEASCSSCEVRALDRGPAIRRSALACDVDGRDGVGSRWRRAVTERGPPHAGPGTRGGGALGRLPSEGWRRWLFGECRPWRLLENSGSRSVLVGLFYAGRRLFIGPATPCTLARLPGCELGLDCLL